MLRTRTRRLRRPQPAAPKALGLPGDEPSAGGVLQDRGESGGAQLAQHSTRGRRRGQDPGADLRQCQAGQPRVGDDPGRHHRVAHAQNADGLPHAHSAVAADRVLDQNLERGRQRGRAVGAQLLDELIAGAAGVQGAAHRVGGESDGEGASARLDLGAALEHRRQRRSGAPRNDRGEVGLNQQHVHRPGQVGGEGLLQPRQEPVLFNEPLLGSGAGFCFGQRARQEAPGPAQRPTPGQAEQLGLGQHRGDRTLGHRAARPGESQYGTHPRRSRRRPLGKRVEQLQHAAAQ